MNKVTIQFEDGTELNLRKNRLQIYDKYDRIEVSDGHHTMSELYEHRHTLFIALLKIYDNYITPLNTRVTCWKSKLHSDGTMFEGWFIAGMQVKQFDGTVKYITYHMPMHFWEKAKVMELLRAPEWDGHDSNEVLKRLEEL